MPYPIVENPIHFPACCAFTGQGTNLVETDFQVATASGPGVGYIAVELVKTLAESIGLVDPAQFDDQIAQLQAERDEVVERFDELERQRAALVEFVGPKLQGEIMRDRIGKQGKLKESIDNLNDMVAARDERIAELESLLETETQPA